MNWEEVGAIGQVLGSLAVFITLVYLSIQTRNAKEATQRAISQARGEAFRHGLAWGAEPRMIEIIVKAATTIGAEPLPFQARLMQEAGLTREEAGSLFYYEMAGWNNRLQGIAAIDGMNKIERHQLDATLLFTYGNEHGISRRFYDWVKPNAHPEAVRYIDAVLARRAA